MNSLGMEKKTFLDDLVALASAENVLSVSREVNELRTRFDDYLLEEERLKQVAVLEARERGEVAEFQTEGDFIRDEFYTVFSVYKEKRNKALETKKALQEESLRQKRSLIARLRGVIENEENISLAFSAYKEIHEAWKKVGDIPREKRDEVQAEYSRLLEDFFYNMKIYRELKDHDLHRNSTLKLDLIQQIQGLEQVASVKEVEKLLKALQNEWEGIGPVGKEEWEAIKSAYVAAVRAAYDRINLSHSQRREQQQDNIEKKQILIEKLKSVCGDLSVLKTVKDWEKKTEEVFDVQSVWKQVGFGPKKENEVVWSLFRAECDVFFEAKKSFFEGLRSEWHELAAAKQQLIDQAKLLKSSTDWKGTAEKIISLQKKWKAIGSAGQRNDQRLWKEFRAACDAFFNAKTAHFSQQDLLNEDNLKAKQELIAKIEAYVLPEDKKQALTELKAFTSAYTAIGHVPLVQKDAIYTAYKAALDKTYQALKLEGKEKEEVMFQAKLETFKASPNAGRLLDKEKMDLRRQIESLKQEVIQYENNLGFFAKSKGANALKEEVEKKIELNKRKIQGLSAKIKLIPSEL
jgi:hypothetical protein